MTTRLVVVITLQHIETLSYNIVQLKHNRKYMKAYFFLLQQCNFYWQIKTGSPKTISFYLQSLSTKNILNQIYICIECHIKHCQEHRDNWGNTITHKEIETNAKTSITRMNVGIIREELKGKSQDLEPDQCEVQVPTITSFVIMQSLRVLEFSLLSCLVKWDFYEKSRADFFFSPT